MRMRTCGVAERARCRNRRGSVCARSAGIAAALLPFAGAPALAGISGVCPDGSIYVVQRPELIPCSSSKQVEPHELPPLRGEYLPRPYGWELHQKRQDQNNPYNLVDLAPSLQLRGGAEAHSAPGDAPLAAEAGAGQRLAPEPRAGSAEPAQEWRAEPLPIAAPLAPEELRDLMQIVELSQESAPARFPAEADGVALDLARSRSFEPHLQQQLGARGPVVLFAARAERPAAAFRGQLTFVQGHRAFYPDLADPAQLGVLSGSLGELSPDEVLLGYVVLPEDYDPSQEIEIFWHDRQLNVTLSPGV